MNEVAVSIILNYMEECLFEPGLKWPDCYFDQRSYSRWAANEILEQIMNRPTELPINIIEEFMIKMLFFSCKAENEHNSLVFSIAQDTAQDLLLLFV